jgi:UPF0271 protein
MSDAAAGTGLPVVTEFFADRPLRGDGSVVMFGWAEVFTATPGALSGRARDLLTSGQVKAIDGTPVPVRADTACVHSNTPARNCSARPSARYSTSSRCRSGHRDT